MAFITYLAEDNSTVLNNLIETLREVANVTVTAHSETQAEASHWLTVHDGHWHLAIVDLFLKEGSGLGILAGCRNREPYQKVVLLTNYATPEIRKRAQALGADEVFDKSTELDLLLAYCLEHMALVKREPTQEAERVAAALRAG
jgi:two-component system, OmpR family, response regulator